MPSLGHWNAISTHLNEWLIADGGNLGRRIACFFKEPKGRSPKLQSTALARGCNDFVKYRNDTLGHGVTLQDAACLRRPGSVDAAYSGVARCGRNPPRLASGLRGRLRMLPDLDGP